MSRSPSAATTDPRDDSATARPRLHPGQPVPGLVLIALACAVLLAVPGGLVAWRAEIARTEASHLAQTRDDALALARIARATEGLRGLARQVRHVPAGSAGSRLRHDAAARFLVLAADPDSRARTPPAFGAALDAATEPLDRLVRRRDAAHPWDALITRRLAALETLAASPGDDMAPPRDRHAAALHAVLAQAARAGAPALPFLDREARRLAALAIAAPGLPRGLGLHIDPMTPGRGLFAAIAAALDVPAARRAQLVENAGADALWHVIDDALARAADIALVHADTRLADAQARARAAHQRLESALGAAGLTLAAVALALFGLAMAGHARPLETLARRAAALGPLDVPEGRHSASRALALIGARIEGVAADRAHVHRAESARQDADHDTLTLGSALLGASAEAATGRALGSVRDPIGTALGTVRAQTALMRYDLGLLSDADTDPGPGTGARPHPNSDRQAAALTRLAEACATIDTETGRAEHLLSALTTLGHAAVPAGAGQPTPPLSRLLEDAAAILTPRAQAAGLDLHLTCPSSIGPVEGNPGLVMAVVVYLVEAAVLRVETRPPSAAGRDRSSPGGYRLGITVQAGDGRYLRLTLEDSGPAPSATTQAILTGDPAAHPAERAGGGPGEHPRSGPGQGPGQGQGQGQGPRRDTATLAHALREAPDAAAILLADALARVGLGRALDIVADPRTGPHITLWLSARTPPPARPRPPASGPATR